MAASSSASPQFTRLAAPLLLGPLFNWTLYGAFCVQVYIYSYNFPNDKLSIKLLTYFLFTLETVQTALTGADLYYWFITGFGDVERLKDTHFAPIDIPIMTAVTSFIVQGYFCYRIWMLNKRLLWLCWIIAICTVTQSSGAVWGAITSLTGRKFGVSKAPVYLWSIPSALADILIAVAMTLLLRRVKDNVAVTSLVLYAAFPNEVYYAFTLDFIGKLYSNTFLVSLNNRIYLRDRLSHVYHDNPRTTVSDRVRTGTVVTLSHFSGPEPQSRSSMSNTFQLYDIARPLDLDKGHGNAASTDIHATV
ncbi:hypothetical protein BJY52DRAFT_121975 [Lactarius psammicola]|nr:hypothetical protein BJY52DRAFT_121975 [Lactarius psammicola]